ncbi:rhamnosyltransferase WsaF family glycosyltransferase [Paeniglutamicibacter gangotriensis]
MKFARLAGDRLGWAELDFPLRPEDIHSLETGNSVQAIPEVKNKLCVAWVCAPPGAGSGGHTTLFRMVQAMEARGHECTLLLYERDSDDVARYEQLIRSNWPAMKARISSATTDTGDFDAVVASSWVTAHVVASRFANTTRPFYFIQDYEPYFYPRGYLYALAAMTYQFGFANIALGEMVANELRTRNGVDPDLVVPFGCDRDVYRTIARPTGGSPRRGVVYYAKQSADRRGYLLAKAALERFHELCPDQEIHIIGDEIRGWTTPVTNHGSMRPAELNLLYNDTIAGLAMSFTNVSLVPGELLAAGNIPVLNADSDVKLDMDSAEVIWAAPHPEELARALAEVVDRSDIDFYAQRAAAGAPIGWAQTQAEVARFIEGRSKEAAPHTFKDTLETEGSSETRWFGHV